MTGADTRDLLIRAARADGPPSSDFDLNPDVALPEGRRLRAAAVLVGVGVVSGRSQVLLTKRSSRLKNHPGQIAFPGGKVDEGDDGPESAARREAQEEVGLPQGHVTVLGTLPPHETVTGFLVTPVLGWIDGAFEAVPEEGEVAEAFWIPFDHLTDPARFGVESRRWRGQRRYYYVVPWGPYYVWGATARILRALAERVAA